MECQGKKNKIVAVAGATASGKTKLAVRLAHKFNGEIVSADSRQVYKGMDVGTGKDLKEYEVKSQKPRNLQNLGMRGPANPQSVAGSKVKRKSKIPYHLIDIVEPQKDFNLALYQKMAKGSIADILKRGKLPIIAGGSGLYLQAIVDGYRLPVIQPNVELRRKYESMDREELFELLKKQNIKFAGRLNDSDRKNKRRLIRCLEICKMPDMVSRKASPAYDPLVIGLMVDKEALFERIKQRIIERLEKEDMVGEVERLHAGGLSWKRLESFGLEYKFISYYLQEKLGYDEMADKLYIASRQFAKRQLTWLKRWEGQGRKILWVKKAEEAEKAVKKHIA